MHLHEFPLLLQLLLLMFLELLQQLLSLCCCCSHGSMLAQHQSFLQQQLLLQHLVVQLLPKGCGRPQGEGQLLQDLLLLPLLRQLLLLLG